MHFTFGRRRYRDLGFEGSSDARGEAVQRSFRVGEGKTGGKKKKRLPDYRLLRLFSSSSLACRLFLSIPSHERKGDGGSISCTSSPLTRPPPEYPEDPVTYASESMALAGNDSAGQSLPAKRLLWQKEEDGRRGWNNMPVIELLERPRLGLPISCSLFSCQREKESKRDLMFGQQKKKRQGIRHVRRNAEEIELSTRSAAGPLDANGSRHYG